MMLNNFKFFSQFCIGVKWILENTMESLHQRFESRKSKYFMEQKVCGTGPLIVD